MGRYDTLLEDPKKAPEQKDHAAPEKKVAPPPPTSQKAHDIKKEGKIPSKIASNKASVLADYPDEIVELIRKSVRKVGKEVTFVRLTPEEKDQLGDIVYTYKRQGTRTSENELARIGINYLIADYQANGDTSILAKVIAALND
jgi:hypothetical protein